MIQIKLILSALWQFVSFVFVPRRGLRAEVLCKREDGRCKKYDETH